MDRGRREDQLEPLELWERPSAQAAVVVQGRPVGASPGKLDGRGGRDHQSGSVPHHGEGRQMDDDDAVAAIAAELGEAFADPAVRAALADLLTGAADARRRRLDELADDLAAWELTWQRREGD
jgi:hypothetical protein